MVSNKIILREVLKSDLPIFHQQQLDPIATYMADFPPRVREEFMAHWTMIMGNYTNIIRTILYNGNVAGNVVSFVQFGKREVGYWIGREFWGKGIATKALKGFLKLDKKRPLYGHVVKDNIGSRRVLEKCGFIISSEDREYSRLRGVEVEGYLLKLD